MEAAVAAQVVSAALDLQTSQAALRTSEPCYAAARAGLMIAGIEDVPNGAYEGLLGYAKEAAALGYPKLV